MKNPTPRQIALISSAIVAVISAMLVIALGLGLPEVLFFLVVILLVSYLVFYFMIEKFIYRKIKVIYKSIHRSKGGGDDRKKIMETMKTDPIMEVSKEVLEWEKGHKSEIEQLENVAKFRKEFLRNVSHELKTPIFNIQGYLDTLLDGGMDDSKVNRKFLEKAVRNAERLSEMVKELEIISDLETGELTLELEKFELENLVTQVFDVLEMKARQNKISMTFKRGNNDHFRVLADKEKIRQVLINLIENSIKYGRRGGHTTVGFYDMDEKILVEVNDNGIGIEESHLPRLFERFYRVDKSRSREEGGSGLGLAIAKHILEAHDESIHVRSREDIGSTFGFTLKKVKE